MNTQLEYLYRDAGNYKWYNDVVIAGVLSLGDVEAYLYEHQFFIPSEVCLPDLQPNELTEDDHVWHEIVCLKETAANPTVEINAQELIDRFKAASKTEWNWFEMMKRCDLR